MPNNYMLVGVLDCDDNENQIVTELIFSYAGFKLTFEDHVGLSVYGENHGYLWLSYQSPNRHNSTERLKHYRQQIREFHRLLILKLIHRGGA
jgi:hypothetical protein